MVFSDDAHGFPEESAAPAHLNKYIALLYMTHPAPAAPGLGIQPPSRDAVALTIVSASGRAMCYAKVNASAKVAMLAQPPRHRGNAQTIKTLSVGKGFG